MPTELVAKIFETHFSLVRVELLFSIQTPTISKQWERILMASQGDLMQKCTYEHQCWLVILQTMPMDELIQQLYLDVK